MSTIKKADQEYVRTKNLKMVLEILKKYRPISRADIVKLTKMSPTSVSRIVGYLIDRELIRETQEKSTGVGRKATLLDINSDSVYTIGVYLNKDIFKLALVDFSGSIVSRKEIDFNKSIYAREDVLVDYLSMGINAFIDEVDIDRERLLGVGLGMPGIIDNKTGRVVFSASMTIRNLELKERLHERLDIDITIDNDVKLKALAESEYGVARDYNKTTLLNLGKGVGSALILDGEIYRGNNNIAGEIGHITVEPNGVLCDCGRRGCIQTFIVESNLLYEANKIEHIESVSQIFDKANIGEQWAQNIIDRAVTYICMTINTSVSMYSPEAVVLCGSLINENDEIIEMIKEKCTHITWEPIRDGFTLLRSQLGEDSNVLGPAILALHTFLKI